MSYSSKISAFKTLVNGLTGNGSMIGTLTSTLSFGEEKRLTAKNKDPKDLSWVVDV